MPRDYDEVDAKDLDSKVTILFTLLTLILVVPVVVSLVLTGQPFIFVTLIGVLIAYCMSHLSNHVVGVLAKEYHLRVKHSPVEIMQDKLYGGYHSYKVNRAVAKYKRKYHR
jgi:hypothetical protein